jgi:hypothetical protein
MRRSHLSLVTAAIVLLFALIWMSLGSALRGLLWVAIGIGWLVTALVQRRNSDAVEPRPRGRLLRRFMRLLLWT